MRRRKKWKGEEKEHAQRKQNERAKYDENEENGKIENPKTRETETKG